MSKEDKILSSEIETLFSKISYFKISDEKLLEQIIDLSEEKILKHLENFGKELVEEFCQKDNVSNQVLEDCKKDALKNTAMLVKLRAEHLHNFINASGIFNIPSHILINDQVLEEFTEDKDNIINEKLIQLNLKQHSCYQLQNKLDELKMLNATVDDILQKMDT